MNPVVYLYEKQIRDFLLKEDTSRHIGFAFGFDNKSVIHGFTVKPAFHAAGSPMSFHLISDDSFSQIEDCDAKEILELCHAEGVNGLVVMAGIESDDRLRLRAFILVEGEVQKAHLVLEPE